LKIISVVNLKGGVGKTAIAVNFAAYCGRFGLKTLLIDLDPQTNATFSCISVSDWDNHAKKKGTVANIMGMKRHTSAAGKVTDPSDIVIDEVFENVDLIPSHLDLFTIDLDLASSTAREYKLKRNLSNIVDDYDIVVCDCPPNLTIPTQNALAMSTHFVVPVSPDFLSALGVGILLKRVKEFCFDLDHELIHLGIVLSRVGRKAIHRDLIKEDIRKKFKRLVFNSEIRERVTVSEAAESNLPIFEMGNPLATKEFKILSKALLNKMGIDI
jgi:chromosome partitioning protein